MTRALEVLMTGGRFFEGPRWHDGKWYVSDFHRHEVIAVDERGRAERIIDVPGHPSGLGWLPDGSLLVVSMTDHRVLRRSPDGRVTQHADISEHCGGWANDMVVDGMGRAYVGNFGFPLIRGSKPVPTTLVLVNEGGVTTVVADDLLFPNGMVITPDGRTLVVGETMRNRYTAFTIQSDGSLAERRVWADLSATADRPKLFPDGCALDADGCIWSADAGLGHLNRIAQGGRLIDRVDPPQGLRFFACALGGAEGRTLLGCAARGYFEALESTSLDAVLATTKVSVARAGRP